MNRSGSEGGGGKSRKERRGKKDLRRGVSQRRQHLTQDFGGVLGSLRLPLRVGICVGLICSFWFVNKLV